MINCTIANNYSANRGGGLATLGASNLIVNCIMANNRSAAGDPNVYNTDATNSTNFYYSCANIALALNQGNITNDPSFADTGTGNWRLKANSPCVNTGTNQNWMTNSVDLDYTPRIRYGRVDMGAYELYYEGTMFIIF